MKIGKGDPRKLLIENFELLERARCAEDRANTLAAENAKLRAAAENALSVVSAFADADVWEMACVTSDEVKRTRDALTAALEGKP